MKNIFTMQEIEKININIRNLFNISFLLKIKFITIDLSVNLKEKIEDNKNDLQARVLDFN